MTLEILNELKDGVAKLSDSKKVLALPLVFDLLESEIEINEDLRNTLQRTRQEFLAAQLSMILLLENKEVM